MAGVQFDEEQHIEPLQPEHVDGEEVASHDACGLLAQERRPGATRPPRRRVEPMAAQRHPDRGRRDAHAEPKQFALDALVAQRGFSLARRTTSCCSRPPGYFYGVVARPRINRWGATDQEHQATWPGDRLLARPGFVWTNAITIRRYQRTASTMTSGGKRKPAKADRGTGATRGRRILMRAVLLVEGGHRERNSALTRIGALPTAA